MAHRYLHYPEFSIRPIMMKHSGMLMIKVSVQLLCWMEIFHSAVRMKALVRIRAIQPLLMLEAVKLIFLVKVNSSSPVCNPEHNS